MVKRIWTKQLDGSEISHDGFVLREITFSDDDTLWQVTRGVCASCLIRGKKRAVQLGVKDVKRQEKRLAS